MSTKPLNILNPMDYFAYNATDGIRVQLLPESIAEEDCGLPRYLQLDYDRHGIIEYAEGLKGII